ncbi:hypothetical protein [Asanoa sp. NPDC050611]|uniref:hypothetical protein n=1 Tax=Asanoa sp. NPDC050611 TaxID=3157098 RepID=UPI0033D5480A
MSDIRSGRFSPDQHQHRLRPGLTVVDRTGVKIGRIRDLHRPDPLAVSDDGRRIGEAGNDIASMIPGWSVHTLPGLASPAAARMVREGYLQIVLHGPPPRRVCYAALTEVLEVDDDAVRLAVSIDDLPVSRAR